MEKIEKNGHVKNIDKSTKYILREERKVRYHDLIIRSDKKKAYNFT